MADRQNQIAKYLSGEISRSEKADLEQWLLEDSSRVQQFAEMLLMASELRQMPPARSELRTPASPHFVETALVASRNGRFGSRGKGSGILSSRPLQWAAAVSLLAATSIAILSRYRELEPAAVLPAAAPAQASRSPSAPRVVAYLGRTTDCVWQSQELAEGTQLTVGSKIALSQGMVEIIFENGARATAQGPCELFVDDAQAFSLRVGSASVYVPDAAFGFKVVTPSGIVVDLGTEFGVAVDRAGSSEVHVFEGEVAFQALGKGGAHHLKAIRVPAARAFQYSIGGTTLHEFEANEAKFDWRKRTPLAESQVPPLPIREELALWFSADRFVDVDENKRVLRWSDLLVGSNTTAEDALQLEPSHRPLLVEDGINGLPSVRFGDSGTFLLTPPLSTANEQTALVVLSLSGALPGFQSIVNYNGPPQRIVGPLGGMVKPAVFEICLRDRNKDGRFAVCGEVFSGFDDGRQNVIKSKVEALDRLLLEQPIVVAFRYSLREEQMALFLNGRKRKLQRAATPIAITSRKIIGRHPILEADTGAFQGDIGELLIYDRALADDEVREVSDYLMQRYAIEANARRPEGEHRP